MPIVTPPVAADNVLPLVGRWVEHRENWGDDWEILPYWTPIRTREDVGPGVGQAVLEYHFGAVLREGTTTAGTYQPVDIRDHYIRVRAQRSGGAAWTAWIGIVIDVELANIGAGTAGRQRATAAGMAHVLDRWPIRSARYIGESGDATQDVCPKFNARRGKNNGQGNRSDDVGSDGVYVFSRDGNLWNARQILDYLLVTQMPTDAEPGLAVTLTGQVEALEMLVGAEHDLGGRSVLEAVNKLIDRRSGAGWRLLVGDDDKLTIDVFTLVENALTFGAKKLPANDRQTTLQLPTAAPWAHVVGEVPMRFSALQRFDAVEVRGSPLVVCATFSYVDETLIEGWDTGTLEADYRLAADDDPTANDLYRATDKFEAVFCRHVVPYDWNFETAGVENGVPHPTLPALDEAGGWDVYTGAECWLGAAEFMRETPLQTGVDYSVAGAAETLGDDEEPEYRPLFAFVDWEEKYALVENLSKLHIEFPDAGVRPARGQLGIQIEVRPRHLYASEFTDPNVHNEMDGTPSMELPKVDYNRIGFTGAFETGLIPRVKLPFSPARETGRTLVVTIDEAKFVFAPMWTVVGISPTGALQHIDPGNRTIRSDADMLQSVAGAAAAWYETERQAATIPFRQPGLYAPLGSLLLAIGGVGTVWPVKTVVSAREIDWTTGTTTLETGWGALDYFPGEAL